MAGKDIGLLVKDCVRCPDVFDDQQRQERQDEQAVEPDVELGDAGQRHVRGPAVREVGLLVTQQVDDQ